jgi:hypothetical protein
VRARTAAPEAMVQRWEVRFTSLLLKVFVCADDQEGRQARRTTTSPSVNGR